jgi:hypothetical protein
MPEDIGKCQWCGYKVPSKTAMTVPLDDIVSIANSMTHVTDLLKNLRLETIAEDVGQVAPIEVTIVKAADSHNLYKIEIPTEDDDPFVAFSIKENIPRKGEKDDETVKRIMDELKAEVQNNIKDYFKKDDAGDEEGAHKALFSNLLEDPEKAEETYREIVAKHAKKPPPKPTMTSRQARQATKAASTISKLLARRLAKKGMLTGKETALKIRIRSEADMPGFSVAFIDKATSKYPHWEELSEAGELQPSEISSEIPEARVTGELVEFVAEMFGIDMDKVSLRAARALAAASKIAAASLIAADKKIGAAEAETPETSEE